MNNITDQEIKESGFSRLELATALGMGYSTLSAKLGGFNKWLPGELEQAREMLKNGRKEA